MDLPCAQFVVVVPAAGIGKRMQAKCPKQYLTINQQTILEHTVLKLLSHPNIQHVVIAISAGDEYFQDLSLQNHPNISVVTGGNARVDSVLAGLLSVNKENYPWVMVHDAARPCFNLADITALIEQTQQHQCGGVLGYLVRDTMKKALPLDHKKSALGNSEVAELKLTELKCTDLALVDRTVEREGLWHALTPQLYKTTELIDAIARVLENNVTVTDESSAMEYAGYPSLLVESSNHNIKITRPDDLALAQFFLSQSHNNHT